MFLKSVQITALIVMMFSVAQAQQPVYWSSTQPNCGSYQTRQLNNGGYVCEVFGLFPWFTAGAGWTTSIRTAAPASAPIAFFFYYNDTNGNALALDANYVDGTGITSGQPQFSAALNPNEPAQLDLFGLSSEAPNYNLTAAQGWILADFQCPDASTCSQATAQLLYSALPSQPWSLSIPIVWNAQLAAVWSTWGFDDGQKQKLAFVVTNGSSVAQIYTVNIYNTFGTLLATINTPAIPSLGAYAQLLETFLGNRTPGGLFKMTVAGTGFSAFEALQFNGSSAATLVVFPEGSTSLVSKDSVNRGLHRMHIADQVVPHIERRR